MDVIRNLPEDSTYELREARYTAKVEQARCDRVNQAYTALCSGNCKINEAGELIATNMVVDGNLTTLFGPQSINMDEQWQSTADDLLALAEKEAQKSHSISRITRGMIMGPIEKAYRSASALRIESEVIQIKGINRYDKAFRKAKALQTEI